MPIERVSHSHLNESHIDSQIIHGANKTQYEKTRLASQMTKTTRRLLAPIDSSRYCSSKATVLQTPTAIFLHDLLSRQDLA